MIFDSVIYREIRMPCLPDLATWQAWGAMGRKYESQNIKSAGHLQDGIEQRIIQQASVWPAYAHETRMYSRFSVDLLSSFGSFWIDMSSLWSWYLGHNRIARPHWSHDQGLLLWYSTPHVSNSICLYQIPYYTILVYTSLPLNTASAGIPALSRKILRLRWQRPSLSTGHFLPLAL